MSNSKRKERARVVLAAQNFLVEWVGNDLLETDDQQKFTIEGGDMLLSALTDHGVKISSSCGGKGSCGYCKVQVESGAGELLPTEEIYMSRDEKLRGIRLACQVKVKSDMEIVMPDFLAMVREAVANNKIDMTRRWLVTVK